MSARAAAQVKIACEFQGHYAEPNLDLTVPMDQLREHKSIEFEMVFHVPTARFEAVKMLAGEDRVHIGDATFVAAPVAAQRRQAAQPQPATRANEIARDVGAGAKKRAGS